MVQLVPIIFFRARQNTFRLIDIETYLIIYQDSVTEPEQLVIKVNDVELFYTSIGRATRTSQIIQTSIITTTIESSVLSIRNPESEAAALTITPLAKGTEPISAHLSIIKIQ